MEGKINVGPDAAIGAFLDLIVAPLMEMPRLGRPSIAAEATEMLNQPRFRWIKEGMRLALTAPGPSPDLSGQEDATEAVPVDPDGFALATVGVAICPECRIIKGMGHVVGCSRTD